MAKKALVIVESPAKAKKIGGFLGPDYAVRASFGHVRDLPGKAADVPAKFKKESWSSLGVNVEEAFDPLYIVPPDKKKVITELKGLLKDADELVVATDEDREGEAIGWHLLELLKPKVPVKRMVFSEITKKAITEAMQNTRQLDTHLVEAQETRRVLDRLYGYTVSPLLWKKINRGLSAGRVQSVATRVLVQRELERLAFNAAEYWDIDARVSTGAESDAFTARLFEVQRDGQWRPVASGKDFVDETGELKAGSAAVHLSEADAVAMANAGAEAEWSVETVEEKPGRRRSYPPFITSSMQQVGSGAQQAAAGAQQVGSGAQQAAAGAQQVGSGAQHAAIGAQHVGSGAQHMAAGAAQVGAQQSSLLPQPPPNSPADANCEPANRQRAAVRVVHFIGVNSSEILREGSRVSRRYPASPIARATRSCLDGVRTCGPGSRRGSRSRPLAGRSLGRSQRQESDSRAAGRRAAGPEGHFVRGGPAPSAFRPDLPVDAGRPRGRSACTGWALSGWAACGPRRDRDGPHAVTRACPASPPAIPDHSPASGSPRGDPDSGILRDRRKMLAISLPTRWPRGGRPRNRPPFSGDPSRRRGGGPRQWPP